MKTGCIFCQIAAGQANAKIVYQDEEITAFWDTRPAAPLHLLIIPNEHIESVNEVNPEHDALLGRLFRVGQQLASENKVEHSGYRLIVNTGPDAGQSVFHLHMHLLAGRRMPFRSD